MKASDKKFWPYKPKSIILLVFGLLILLILITGILRSKVCWFPDVSTNTVLIGILILSLLPLLLAILDIIIERGGSIGFKDFKIDFSKVNYSASAAFEVPPNIGGFGVPVNETSITDILKALKKAGESNIVIVDIEDGSAWWETRLLLLVEGATRLGKPDKIVFIGKVSQQEKYFLGWAKPSDLLPLLLSSNTTYSRLYYIANAAALQWALVEPSISGPTTVLPTFIKDSIAKKYTAIAFDNNGLPKEFLTEEILGRELGVQVEKTNGNVFITQGKLIDLFGEALMKDRMDDSWAAEEQLKTFFAGDTSFLAITQNGKYLKLVPRVSILKEILQNTIGMKKPKIEN